MYVTKGYERKIKKIVRLSYPLEHVHDSIKKSIRKRDQDIKLVAFISMHAYITIILFTNNCILIYWFILIKQKSKKKFNEHIYIPSRRLITTGSQLN